VNKIARWQLKNVALSINPGKLAKKIEMVHFKLAVNGLVQFEVRNLLFHLLQWQYHFWI